MCGIAGVLSLGDARPGPDQLERMLEVVEHRGPDEQGIHIDGPVGLGHRRLSIIDLEGGKQPMHLPEAGLSLTYNGEIFNYIELREELEKLGHTFITRSDTEVVLHLYQEFGRECLSRMNGQWAFAIWDRNRRSLFLTRDRVGIRPLVYTVQGGMLAFASEVKSLLALPWVRREVDHEALADVFTFWHPLPPRTFFRGIHQLPPGSTLEIDADGSQPVVRRYWQMTYAPDEGMGSDDEVAEQLFSLLEDATTIRLRADVPVGAYLSGGLDSSTTAGLIQHSRRTHLCSFSVAFTNPEFDEYDFQREVAQFLGTHHEVVHCGHGDICTAFPRVVRHTETPIVRTAPSPLFLLSDLVRRNDFKVVLTGEGADEVLGGYDIFKEAKIRRFWGRRPESKLRPLLFKKLYPYMAGIQNQPLDYLKAFFRVRPEDLDDPLFSHMPRWDLGMRNHLFLSGEVKATLDGHNGLEEVRGNLPPEYQRWDPFSQAQYLELTYLMPGYILSSQGDRMSMAHSVEGRFPFLDYRVVELGGRIPPRLKMKALDEKHVLKRAMKEIVPPRIRARSKQPYRAPDAVSFYDADGAPAEEYVGEVLSPGSLKRSGLFNPRAVGKLVEKARAHRAVSIKDNMAFVGILSAQLLCAEFL